ncbi:hypothetical protein ACMFMG_002607 [Clarireedia jacksonii]
MPNETSVNRLLWAMLSQKSLKDIDWNKVAMDPILSQEITNGHAARMRYSRFKKQMEDATPSKSWQLKTNTHRRGKAKKRTTLKRKCNLKGKKINTKELPFCRETEQQYPCTPPPLPSAEDASGASGLRTPPPTLKRPKVEPFPEQEFGPVTSSLSSRLSTPLLLSAHSDFSPTSPSFPTPGVVTVKSTLHSSSLNTQTENQSIPPTQLYRAPNNHPENRFGFPSEFCMEEWDESIEKYAWMTEERNADGETVLVKEEEEYPCGIFL